MLVGGTGSKFSCGYLFFNLKRVKRRKSDTLSGSWVSLYDIPESGSSFDLAAGMTAGVIFAFFSGVEPGVG